MTAGRPTSMTPETVQKLEEAFSLGCSDIEACLVAGICKQTLYNYQDANPEFVGRKEQLKEKPVLLARTTVVNDIKTNPEMAMKYLERKCKKEFSTRQESEVTGANGGALEKNVTVTYVDNTKQEEK